MRKIHVNLGENSYDILIDSGILGRACEYINYNKVAIITDENVDKYYGDALLNSLSGDVKKLVLPAGESTKSIPMLQKVYDFLLDFQITRKDVIIALGGGVIGDLTGFAASTLLRGVPFIQIPTTLLAQVDSSVGGKVAVNVPQGKNLIGSFYQPKIVLIDTDCLKTLPKRVIADGMAEVIKYGCIRDVSLFELLANENPFDAIDEIIETCCNIKRIVVEADEFDLGERMILNFGHTLGHAVENYYNYSKYTHGEGVAIGMYNASLAGEKMGITPFGTAEKIKNILVKYNLPYKLDIDKNCLTDAMSLDKKSENSDINLILLDKIGNAIIKKLPKLDVLNYF